MTVSNLPPGEALLSASESGSEESAAPHLGAPEGEVWSVDPLPKDRALTPEEKWPGEWHAIAWMVAHGSSQRQIARELDYTEGRISVILSKPQVQEKIEAIRREFGSASLDKRFTQTAPKALDFFEKVIDGREPARTGERLQASQWMLEKVTGKPKQEGGASDGNTILQLFQALDAIKAKTAEAAAKGERPVLEIEARPKDALADWVSTHIPDETGGQSGSKE